MNIFMYTSTILNFHLQFSCLQQNKMCYYKLIFISLHLSSQVKKFSGSSDPAIRRKSITPTWINGFGILFEGEKLLWLIEDIIASYQQEALFSCCPYEKIVLFKEVLVNTQLTRRKLNQLRYDGSFVPFQLNYLEIYFLEFVSLFCSGLGLAMKEICVNFGRYL